MRLLFTILIFGINLCTNAQEKQKFVLNISFDNGVEIPKHASLELSHFDKSLPVKNSLKIDGNRILAKGDIGEPVLAMLYLNWQNNSIRIQFLLPVDTGEIRIDVNKKVTVNFKNENKLYKNYSNIITEISNLRQTLNEKVKAINYENRLMSEVQKEIDSIEAHYEKLIDNEVYKKTFEKYNSSFLGAIALMAYAERPFSHQKRKFETDSLLKVYSSFTSEIKTLPSMQAFHKLLIYEKKLTAGNSFPSFKLKDTLHNTLQLSKLYGNKYTLIDFWANWCAPCRAEHPNMLNLFKKYKDKGFKIISVSIDKATDQYLWKEAIANDRINIWPHFIDTDQNAKEQMKIRFIPANFLIDSKGNIMAKYLRGDDLNKKLENLFEY